MSKLVKSCVRICTLMSANGSFSIAQQKIVAYLEDQCFWLKIVEKLDTTGIRQ